MLLPFLYLNVQHLFLMFDMEIGCFRVMLLINKNLLFNVVIRDTLALILLFVLYNSKLRCFLVPCC